MIIVNKMMYPDYMYDSDDYGCRRDAWVEMCNCERFDLDHPYDSERCYRVEHSQDAIAQQRDVRGSTYRQSKYSKRYKSRQVAIQRKKLQKKYRKNSRHVAIDKKEMQKKCMRSSRFEIRKRSYSDPTDYHRDIPALVAEQEHVPELQQDEPVPAKSLIQTVLSWVTSWFK